MSGYPPESYPPDPYPPQGYPPGSYPPGSGERDPYAVPTAAISARVTPAAVALLIVAIMNLLLGLVSGAVGAVYTKIPRDSFRVEFERQMQKQNPEQVKEMQRMGLDSDAFLNMYIYGGFGLSCLNLFFSLLTILGAIRMMMLKSYGLAVLASILTIVPCISLTGCCCVGEVVGIWALVVLLNQEVRSAFS